MSSTGPAFLHSHRIRSASGGAKGGLTGQSLMLYKRTQITETRQAYGERKRVESLDAMSYHSHHLALHYRHLLKRQMQKIQSCADSASGVLDWL
ncbi:hypothetical protein L249_6549 [Ophiocordyceps polyrhachis-furcata BCC 54312]|uniref:Uncharacterized protein n=1 Tax=Ophiocordyceps polyrhachis-furcata BCC 54312 TaxID=1330021 RepID=A0A367LLV5_9HYPO|nr:hypothetical protein L249_6549 [Ophiocordyceps polyrhachis-furcata BCC 54312]